MESFTQMTQIYREISTKEEKKSFMHMMYAAMGKLLQQEGLDPNFQTTPTPVIPENRVETVEELPVATEVIPIDD